jgi:magnesium-transporting ATPase (P-type)
MKIHHLSTEEAFSSMQSAPSWLTSQEARRRLAEYGPNDVEKVPRQLLLPMFSCQETKSLWQNPAGKSRPRH